MNEVKGVKRGNERTGVGGGEIRKTILPQDRGFWAVFERVGLQVGV